VKITTWVIGIGSGHPDHLTAEAVRAMNGVEVFLVADKGETKHDLAALRSELCRTVIDHDRYRFVEVEDPQRDRAASDYDAAVRRWHQERAGRYGDVIKNELPGGGHVGFLVWGDPAFYDSTIRIAESLGGPELEVDLRVMPGISSLQLLAAAHKIVLNQIGQPLHLTTGRRLLSEYTAELGDVLVMLDGGLACADLVPLHPDLVIYWGAQLGLADECLVAGRLSEVINMIADERDRIRAARGWVLDTYLLRRP
jgi:precorrin-6A synthase